MQRLQWGTLLFVVWVGLTNSFHPQELLAGLAVSAAIVWLTLGKRPAGEEDRPWRPLPFLAYLPIFLKNLVLSNIDVTSTDPDSAGQAIKDEMEEAIAKI